MTKIRARGTKAEVFEGLAHRTAGGLVKSDLILNARKKVVSKKQQQHGKRSAERLRKHQFRKKKTQADSSATS